MGRGPGFCIVSDNRKSIVSGYCQILIVQVDVACLIGGLRRSVGSTTNPGAYAKRLRGGRKILAVPLGAGALTPRMQELILLAMHATASALISEAIVRQVGRARLAGASEEGILHTLISLVGLANHARCTSVPVLEEELAQAGVLLDVPSPHADFEETKNRFIASRGFWNSDRDRLARLLPDYLLAQTELSVECSQSSQQQQGAGANLYRDRLNALSVGAVRG